MKYLLLGAAIYGWLAMTAMTYAQHFLEVEPNLNWWAYHMVFTLCFTAATHIGWDSK